MQAQGENCGNPIVIGANASIIGTTADAGNDYVLSASNRCIGPGSSLATAPDVVYRVTVPGLNRTRVTLDSTDAGWDSTVNLIRGAANCGAFDAGITAGASCEVGRDDPDNQPVSYANGSSSPVDVLILVDGWSSGLGAFDLTTLTTPIGAGDICENAVPLMPGAPLMGENLGAADLGNDYSGAGTTGQCSTSSSGNDKVYSISIPSGQRLTVTVTPTGFDSSISLVDGSSLCADRTCLAFGNTSGSGSVDTLTFFNVGATRTFFVIVDSATTGGGLFNISASLATPIAGDVCPGAIVLDAGTLLTAQTTTGAGSDYTGSGIGARCSASAAGPDLVYSVAVPAGHRVTFEARPDAGFDPSVSVAVNLNDCNLRTCIGGANSAGAGAVEAVTSSNRGGPATFYGIVDSTSTVGGQFDVLATVEPSPVGDLCETATPLASGTALIGTTFGYTNDYTLTGANCSAATGGQDRTYSLSVPSLSQVVVTLVSDGGYNGVVNLVAGPAANCDANPRVCLANDNTGGTNGTDRVRWANTGNASASVFAIIDSTSAASGTAQYEISAAVSPIPANEVCETAGAPITASTSLMGTLAGAGNDYVWGGLLNCSSAGTLSADLVYAVTIPVGQRVIATVATTGGSWNPTLQVAEGSCNGLTACVTGADLSSSTAVGSSESVIVRNTGAAPRTVFVVVDSSSTTPAGFSLSFDIGAERTYARAPIPVACDDLSMATAIPGTNGDDVTSALIALPTNFAFNFFGAPVTQYSVNSNGLMMLHGATGTTSATGANVTMPTAAAPNGLVAPFWDDFDAYAMPTPASVIRAATFGTAPNRRFTVEWSRVGFYLGSSERLTFQAQLNETTNVIEFHYCALELGSAPTADAARLGGNSATVGLEAPNGLEASLASFNTPMSVTTATGLRFTP